MGSETDPKQGFLTQHLQNWNMCDVLHVCGFAEVDDMNFYQIFTYICDLAEHKEPPDQSNKLKGLPGLCSQHMYIGKLGSYTALRNNFYLITLLVKNRV